MKFPSEADYLSAEFIAPWHSSEWLTDAESRYRRAVDELSAATAALLAGAPDLSETFRLRDEVYRKADNMVRAKRLFREIVRARERLPPRPLRICDECYRLTASLGCGLPVLCPVCAATGGQP